MKTFKQLISELQVHSPVASIDRQTGSLNSHNAIHEINRNLSLVCAADYQDVHEAFNKIRKVLESYGAHIGKVTFEDPNKGSIKLPLTTYYSSGESLKKGDTTPPFSEKNVTHQLTFTYNLIDGLYNCKAIVK